jgi:hypothetical protein
MRTIDLSDDELAAVSAAIRRAIEDDKFPHAPRLDPLRAALAGSKRPHSQPRRRRLRRQPKPASGRGDNSGHCVAANALVSDLERFPPSAR